MDALHPLICLSCKSAVRSACGLSLSMSVMDFASNDGVVLSPLDRRVSRQVISETINMHSCASGCWFVHLEIVLIRYQPLARLDRPQPISQGSNSQDANTRLD